MKKILRTVLFILLIIVISVLIWSQIQLKKADDAITEANKIIGGETNAIYTNNNNSDTVCINSNQRQTEVVSDEEDIVWSYVPDDSDAFKAREESILQDTISEVIENESLAVFDTDYSAADIVEGSAEVADPVAVNYGFTDDEVYEIARITYLETGCLCDYYTVYLTACVIINRYLDWGYNSMSEVIHAPRQYATADKYDDWGGGELRINDRTWSAVYDAIADTDRNPHYQMSKGYDMAVYYADPDWNECFYY